MTREDFIESIISNIDDKFAKIEVKNELEAHLDDRIAFYTDAGYNYDYALEKAIERMGDAEELSENLSGIHNTENYRKFAYLFTVLYGLGAILGLVLTVLYFFRVIDLAEYSALPCVCSAIVFFVASLGFVYSQKAQDDGVFILFSGVSLFNWIAAPLTFIPCGFSILSLIFQFPYVMYDEGQFDYFYYPLESSIFNFFTVNETVDEIITIILWILMCAFGLFPIFSGIISFISFLKNKNNPNRKFTEKARRYGKFLIILSIIGIASITTEMAVEAIIVNNNYQERESSFVFDFNDVWDKFNSIPLPLSVEQAKKEALQNGSIYSEKEIDKELDDIGMLEYYSNNWCEIILDYEPDSNGKLDGNFYSKRFLNLHNSDLEHKYFEKLKKLKKGTAEEEIWEIVSPQDLDSCTIEFRNNTNKKIFVFSNPDTEDDIKLYVEDGVLTQILEDGEDLL